MKLQDLNVDNIYIDGDAVFKVIYIDLDSEFAVVIHYSLNHHVYNIETWKSDNIYLDYVEIVNEHYYHDLFKNIDVTKLN
jgi:hypothetical protein